MFTVTNIRIATVVTLIVINIVRPFVDEGSIMVALDLVQVAILGMFLGTLAKKDK